MLGYCKSGWEKRKTPPLLWTRHAKRREPLNAPDTSKRRLPSNPWSMAVNVTIRKAGYHWLEAFLKARQFDSGHYRLFPYGRSPGRSDRKSRHHCGRVRSDSGYSDEVTAMASCSHRQRRIKSTNLTPAAALPRKRSFSKKGFRHSFTDTRSAIKIMPW